MVILEHEGNVENTSGRQASQMTGVFNHSVIHGLGFFICFNVYILHAFSMFYTLIQHRFLTNRSARRVPSIF